MINVYEQALILLKKGISFIPVDAESKQPQFSLLPNGSWSEFKTRIPTLEETEKWFTGTSQSIAIIGGKVSGNLEIIDFDNHKGNAKDILREFGEIMNNHGLPISQFPCETSQSGGFHLFYQSEVPVDGNKKLAKQLLDDGKIDTCIETRGEGGYVVIAPSNNYKFINLTIADLPMFTAEERELILSVARSFNEVVEPRQQYVVDRVPIAVEERPGDDFNSKGAEEVKSLLINHGWSLVSEAGDKQKWRRPGKSKGISATYNYVPGKLYVFSSNCYPFDSERSYDNFSIFTMLKAGGDFKEATKELASQGYGKSLNGNGSRRNGKSNKAVNPQGEIVDEFKLDIPEEEIFWEETMNAKGQPVLKLSKMKLIRVLERNGYAKYWVDENISTLVNIQNNIICEVTPETIIDFVKSKIEALPQQISENFEKSALLEYLMNNVVTLRSKDFLELISAKKIHFHTDTKDTSYFYFQNGYVVVSKDKVELKPYSELDGYIWKDQKIEHNLKLIDEETASDTSNCLFGRFLEKVCSPATPDCISDKSKRKVDESRLSALVSAVGYLLHTYQDPAIPKAVVFCEEKIAKDDESNGRTGKGLTAYALKLMRKRVLYNGKQVDFRDRFIFQKITPDTQLIVFDDVKKNFDFEFLFSVLTEGITIEKKGQKPIDIPFSRTPKILISTNSVLSNDTDSHKARKFEIEFSDYFSADWTPFDEFKTNFFESGWSKNDEEWDRFYSFMIYSIYHYLGNGLVEYQQINLEERKLLAKVPEEFLEICQEEFERFKIGEKVYKEEIYEEFIKRNKIYGPTGKYAVTQRTTTKWFALFLNFQNANFLEYKNTTRDDKRKYWKLNDEDYITV